MAFDYSSVIHKSEEPMGGYDFDPRTLLNWTSREHLAAMAIPGLLAAAGGQLMNTRSETSGAGTTQETTTHIHSHAPSAYAFFAEAAFGIADAMIAHAEKDDG